MDLSYPTGQLWAVPAVARAVTMATVFASASRSLTLWLYLIGALTALTVVAVEYRSFSRRVRNGG